MLSGKRFILGITGSIAAYKAAMFVRFLVKSGAEVKIVMTQHAKDFITPLTLATLSKNPILVDFYNPENGDWNSHVKLGLWADALIIAPATANTIAKMSNGIADNLLLTTYFSARCPVFVAPAMDMDMFLHSATQDNIATLKNCGVHIIEPESGELASGLEGKGRMAEPENIITTLENYFSESALLKGKHFMVTAGATVEKIDAVRYISNYSTGKMGYAVAEALAAKGADVTLISGRTSLFVQHKNIRLICVDSALEMFEECTKTFPQTDGAVLVAAVADYRPSNPSEQKIKRESDTLTLSLVANPDIAAALGNQKYPHQILVGFALESENGIEHAQGKLQRKKLDYIVMNTLQNPETCFDYNTNQITVIDTLGHVKEYPKKSKPEVAEDIVNIITEHFQNL